MKINFDDILSVEGVYGAFLISGQGEYLASNFRPMNDLYIHANGMVDICQHILDPINWPEFVKTLGKIETLELLFERGKCYITRQDPFYIIVVLEKYAPMGMVRLFSDLFFLKLISSKTGKNKTLRMEIK